MVIVQLKRLEKKLVVQPGDKVSTLKDLIEAMPEVREADGYLRHMVLRGQNNNSNGNKLLSMDDTFEGVYKVDDKIFVHLAKHPLRPI